MNFKSNIPEYHDVSYIQTESPSASSSTSSPTITTGNIPYTMWSLYRPTLQPFSTTCPIYPPLPPSPSNMGYQQSPTSSSFYSPTSQSSDYCHPLSATQSHVSKPITFYANSLSMYTYQTNNYYNSMNNSREGLHLIEPPPIPIPIQSRSMPLPVKQHYQQQAQFQVQMQNQTHSTQFVVGSPQTQNTKYYGLPSLGKNKRKHKIQKEDNNEEQEFPENRLKRTRSASTSTINNNKNANPETTIKNQAKRKKKATATRTPDTQSVSSPSETITFQEDDTATLVQLENELSFLNDECATILMMLNSLRNAYLADKPNQSQQQLSFHDTPIVIEEQQRRSTDFIQNRDIEKEMRIAYDDLMLQVRQVEKKISKIERRSQMITAQRSTQLNADETQDQLDNQKENDEKKNDDKKSP